MRDEGRTKFKRIKGRSSKFSRTKSLDTCPVRSLASNGTCEDGRGIASVITMNEPVAEPAPLAIVPVQTEDVAVAVRVPQNRSVEEDVGCVPFVLFFQASGMRYWFFQNVKKLDGMLAETEEELALSENNDSSHEIQRERKRKLMLHLNQWINELNRLATEQMKIAILKDGAEAMAAQNRNYQLSEQADNLEKAKSDPSITDWAAK